MSGGARGRRMRPRRGAQAARKAAQDAHRRPLMGQGRGAGMRLGQRQAGGGGHAGLDAAFDGAVAAYRGAMAALVEPKPAKVMLGDSTITDEQTFDPLRTESYYARVMGVLAARGWDAREPSTTRDGDVRRIFAKCAAPAGGGHEVSVHMSVQFRALLYYRPVYRVVECQKELSEAAALLAEREKAAAASGERRAAALLRDAGHGPDAGPQELFEALYNDDGLLESVRAEVDSAAGGAGAEARRLAEKKAALLAELDSLLIETYRTTDVLIDDARLVTGEEGILLTADVGPRGGGGGGGLDVPGDAAAAAASRVAELGSALSECAPPG